MEQKHVELAFHVDQRRREMSELNSVSRLRKLSEREKQRLIDKIAEDAKTIETEVYGCARSVLASLQKNLEIGNAEVIRASVGLGAGVARNLEVCGAVSGAVMAVGLIYGTEKLTFPFGAHVKEKKADEEAGKRYADVMTRGGMICDRVRAIYGGLRCSDIQRATRGGRCWDLKDPKQLVEYLQPAIHDHCGPVAGTVARIAAEEILKI
jgi:C_GCAxxG_C_C family probable redox protein